jgi:hypothetical protein
MSKRGGRPPRATNKNNKWIPAEVEVIYNCLGDADFMREHEAYPLREFPTARPTPVTVVEGGDYHKLCFAIAERVKEVAGEANHDQLRPLQSIAGKITNMREHALASGGEGLTCGELFNSFDLNSFLSEPKTLQRKSGIGAVDADATVQMPVDYVPPVRDAAQISFQTRILNAHIACGLCTGYLKEACTIIECLHTFCKECIKRHFASSQLCPTCDKHLGANPADTVRNDRTLQAIVDKVLPSSVKAYDRSAAQVRRARARRWTRGALWKKGRLALVTECRPCTRTPRPRLTRAHPRRPAPRCSALSPRGCSRPCLCLCCRLCLLFLCLCCRLRLATAVASALPLSLCPLGMAAGRAAMEIDSWTDGPVGGWVNGWMAAGGQRSAGQAPARRRRRRATADLILGPRAGGHAHASAARAALPENGPADDDQPGAEVPAQQEHGHARPGARDPGALRRAGPQARAHARVRI